MKTRQTVRTNGSGPVGAGEDLDIEPRSQRKSPPIWIVIVFALVFYWVQLFLDSSVAAFQPHVSPAWTDAATLAKAQPYDPTVAMMALGKAKYETTCAGCHQSTGAGSPGVAPPLAGSEWVTTAGVGRAVRIVFNGVKGPIEVAGKQYNMNPMLPGLGYTMTHAELAALLSYVRNSWGNKAPFVTEEQVTRVFEKIKDRSEQWTAEELLAVPESE